MVRKGKQMFFVVVVLIYIILGTFLTLAFIKWGGLPEDNFAFVVFAFWPLFGVACFVLWISEKTPWYKRHKWRQRLRVIVSEENETDESFLRRSKRL
jgi:fatty acid desaturase